MGIGPISLGYITPALCAISATAACRICSGLSRWGASRDGEMDEPREHERAHLAARERLDNPHLVVNCNLHRLDGPVRATGVSLTNLEQLFSAGLARDRTAVGSDWMGLRP